MGKKTAPKRATKRPYRIVITVHPATASATIRLRGQTTTLLHIEQGWETGKPRQFVDFMEPSNWLRFYLQGIKGRLPRKRSARKY